LILDEFVALASIHAQGDENDWLSNLESWRHTTAGELATTRSLAAQAAYTWGEMLWEVWVLQDRYLPYLAVKKDALKDWAKTLGEAYQHGTQALEQGATADVYKVEAAMFQPILFQSKSLGEVLVRLQETTRLALSKGAAARWMDAVNRGVARVNGIEFQDPAFREVLVAALNMLAEELDRYDDLVAEAREASLPVVEGKFLRQQGQPFDRVTDYEKLEDEFSIIYGRLKNRAL
jgi:hypothetical protein